MKPIININGPRFKDFCIGFKNEFISGKYILLMIFYPWWWTNKHPEDPTTKLGWIKFGLSRIPFISRILGETFIYGIRQGIIEIKEKLC